MQKEIDMVEQWHRVFNAGIAPAPTNNVGDHYKKRTNLLHEEVTEYYAAVAHEGVRDTAKELADIVYLALGAVVRHGLQDYFTAAFHEVHKSNMSKVDPSGNPIVSHTGKILKEGTRYKPADLSFIPEELSNPKQ